MSVSVRPYYLLSAVTVGYGWIPLPIGFCIALWRIRRPSVRPAGMSYRRALVGCVLGALVGTLLFQTGPFITSSGGATELGCSANSLPVLNIIAGLQQGREVAKHEERLEELEKELKAKPVFVREALWVCKRKDGSLTNSFEDCPPDKGGVKKSENDRLERGATFQIASLKESKWKELVVRGTVQRPGQAASPMVLTIESGQLEVYLSPRPAADALKAMPPEIAAAIEKGQFVEGMNMQQLRMALGRPNSTYALDQTPWFDGPAGMSSFSSRDGQRVALSDEAGLVRELFGPEEAEYAIAANEAVKDYFDNYSESAIHYERATLTIYAKWIDARKLSAADRKLAKEEVGLVAREAYKGSMPNVVVKLALE